jgi:hypothetical protein
LQHQQHQQQQQTQQQQYYQMPSVKQCTADTAGCKSTPMNLQRFHPLPLCETSARHPDCCSACTRGECLSGTVADSSAVERAYHCDLRISPPRRLVKGTCATQPTPQGGCCQNSSTGPPVGLIDEKHTAECLFKHLPHLAGCLVRRQQQQMNAASMSCTACSASSPSCWNSMPRRHTTVVLPVPARTMRAAPPQTIRGHQRGATPYYKAH